MAATKSTQVFFGSRTDVGRVRERNEDSLAVKPPLFVVADGMGGHKAGDVASEVAVENFMAVASGAADADELGRAVEAANHAVIVEARRAGQEGMGTTLTAAAVHGTKILVAHVGDSRAYLLHAGKLQQLTRDHSWVADMVERGELTPEEARVHPNRSVITRALGSDPRMQPDLYEITASAGDRLLLCSDGLHSMVEDGDIQSLMARVRDPQRCASVLVDAALEAGGTDNVTVIVADVLGDAVKRERRERFRGRTWMVLVLLALVAVLAGTAFGVNAWVRNSAYLAEQDGKVAIYQGIPESILGFETHWLYRVTDVSVSELQPSAQAHIREGIRKDNLEAAEQLVSEYERQTQQDAMNSTKSTSASTSASTKSGNS